VWEGGNGWQPSRGKGGKRPPLGFSLREKRSDATDDSDLASNGPQSFSHIHAPKINLWQHFFGILECHCWAMRGVPRVAALVLKTYLFSLPRRPREDMGLVWFSFFLTSFSENLTGRRIWLWGESEYHYDYVWRKIKLFIRLRI
jgi:hypothetical protein